MSCAQVIIIRQERTQLRNNKIWRNNKVMLNSCLNHAMDKQTNTTIYSSAVVHSYLPRPRSEYLNRCVSLYNGTDMEANLDMELLGVFVDML